MNLNIRQITFECHRILTPEPFTPLATFKKDYLGQNKTWLNALAIALQNATASKGREFCKICYSTKTTKKKYRI